MPSLFFEKAGKGRTLIFIHGFCDTHEVWTDFAAPFADNFNIIALDLPGFGNSGGLPSPFTIDQVAAEVAGWIGGLQIEMPIVVGHSLGGYVTLSLVEQYPQLLEAFVLFHSTARADAPERKEVRNKVIAFVNENGVQPYIDTFVPGLFFDKSNPNLQDVHARASRTRPEILTGYAQAMRDRPDRSHVLSKVAIPKLLIAGQEDTLIPVQSVRDQAKTAQNARFYELESVGHMGQFEAKSKCQAVIRRFAEDVFFAK